MVARTITIRAATGGKVEQPIVHIACAGEQLSQPCAGIPMNSGIPVRISRTTSPMSSAFLTRSTVRGWHWLAQVNGLAQVLGCRRQ
jgi:hypothetical protein